MRNKRHVAESPWASFSDALSGMLFVFIITTFYFAWQLATAQAAAKAREQDAANAIATIKGAKDLAERLTSETEARSVTSCLKATSGEGVRIDASPQEGDARITMYLGQGVEWFETNKATLGDVQKGAVHRIRHCIDALAARQADQNDEVSKYRVRVFLEGHTDVLTVKGSDAGGDSNWELSARRAAAVLREVLSAPKDAPSRIREAQGLDRLQLIAVGMAEQRPAWARICRVAEQPEPDPAIVDEFDRAVCKKLEGGQVLTPETWTDLRKNFPGAFELDELCRKRRDELHVDNLTGPELLQLWANRCVRPSQQRDNPRLGLLRRVDLRLELTPVTP